MNADTMRRLDRWLGRPICGVLTLWRRLDSVLRPWPTETEAPLHKILFVKLVEQGATVLAVAALRRAVEMVGRENVYFWVLEENRPILDLLAIIPPENVLVVRASGLLVFVRDVLTTTWRARRIGIDATVDMEFFSRASAILAYLTGAARRVGLHRFTTEGPYRGDLMTHRVQHNPYLHTAESYYMLVECLREDPGERPLPKRAVPKFDPAPPQFVPREGETAGVQAKLQELSGRAVGRPIVVLNPNASDMLPIRKWATERFIELGRRLLEDRADLTLAITGAPSERDAAEAIARKIGPPDRVISLAGHTTLRDLFTLYTMADVLVTNDSGPGHFASMTRVQSLVLFGPETPRLYGPLGPCSHVMSAELACSPCVNAMNHRLSPCSDNACMQEITVARVHTKVTELLATAAGGRPRPTLQILQLQAAGALTGRQTEPMRQAHSHPSS